MLLLSYEMLSFIIIQKSMGADGFSKSHAVSAVTVSVSFS